ncbi:MAG: hydroxypyruvate isomerase, partial [Acidobacteria bacterium]|nr:hydroxypyruvate isomerase [Acidobacteriota bacterium]
MLTRREIVTRGPLAAIAGIATAATAGPQDTGRAVRRGRLKQSVCRWPYGKIPLREFCRAVADLGLTGIDLLNV